MSQWRRALGIAAIVGAFVAYPILAHFIAAAPPTAHLGIVAFSVAPLIGAVAILGWHSSYRAASAVLSVAACALVWLWSEPIGKNLALVYFIQTTCANAALALVFGRTLFGGREPLCSRFARMVRGPLESRVARYTRQVTVAWTLFFVAMLAASTLLYLLAPISMWSAFANLLNIPLVGLMFVAEYAVRTRMLPDMPHAHILESLRAYWNSPRVSSPPPR